MSEQPMQAPKNGEGLRGITTRRAFLGAGLAVTPVVLVAVLRDRTAARTVASGRANTRPLTQAAPSCVVTPQLTEGPYFVDERLYRSDIRSDPSTGVLSEGAPLHLTFKVLDVTSGGCAPLVGAAVDVWHCDALGVYSDVVDQMGAGFNTKGQQFLRGAQFTDEAGAARFQTIYPGWYQGRAVHTHFKVRTDPTSETGYEFTSQFFYDEALTDIVHAQTPYAAKGQRTLRNEGDGIFLGGGDQLLIAIDQDADGYAATIEVGVDLSAPAPAAGPGGPGGPGGRPPGPPPQRP